MKWNNNGCRSTVWRCVSRVQKKMSGIDCPARTVREEDLRAAGRKAGPSDKHRRKRGGHAESTGADGTCEGAGRRDHAV
ncbi:hypothetical protein [Hornefia butyriciproducens]|uniref:hypothetical protein n=1 Tax=Hornefia butyriciproducens TaxID=2652293 RepID=UPI003F8C2ED5